MVTVPSLVANSGLERKSTLGTYRSTNTPVCCQAWLKKWLSTGYHTEVVEVGSHIRVLLAALVDYQVAEDHAHAACQA